MSKRTVSDAIAEMLHQEEERIAMKHARFLAEMRVWELRESVGAWPAGSETIRIRVPRRFQQKP